MRRGKKWKKGSPAERSNRFDAGRASVDLTEEMCEKVSYRSQQLAERALQRYVQNNRQSPAPSRTEPRSTYRCPRCGFWHMTKGVA